MKRVTAMYEDKAQMIVEELGQVFKRVSSDEVESFIAQIMKAKRVILIGVGREGLSTKAFTMRLMHLGFDAHWIWDETTPSMGKGDLLIATSGCGEIGHIDYVAEKAKERGATVAVITGDPHKKTPKLADTVLSVPASVYLGTADVVPSIQPMGNLFEQSLLILLDMIIMDLRDRMSITKEKMEANHRNLE
jgi:6-phospho-3-hexuloisomerase